MDDCERGAMCWEAGGTWTGTCVELYVFDSLHPGCGDPMTTSFTDNSSIQGACPPKCNPLANDCGLGEACRWSATLGKGDGFWCALFLGQEAGDTCSSPYDCADGFSCALPINVPTVDDGTCKPHCSLAAPVCASGSSCHPWYGESKAPPGHQDIGLCVPD